MSSCHNHEQTKVFQINVSTSHRNKKRFCYSEEGFFLTMEGIKEIMCRTFCIIERQMYSYCKFAFRSVSLIRRVRQSPKAECTPRRCVIWNPRTPLQNPRGSSSLPQPFQWSKCLAGMMHGCAVHAAPSSPICEQAHWLALGHGAAQTPHSKNSAIVRPGPRPKALWLWVSHNNQKLLHTVCLLHTSFLFSDVMKGMLKRWDEGVLKRCRWEQRRCDGRGEC